MGRVFSRVRVLVLVVFVNVGGRVRKEGRFVWLER